MTMESTWSVDYSIGIACAVLGSLMSHILVAMHWKQAHSGAGCKPQCNSDGGSGAEQNLHSSSRAVRWGGGFVSTFLGRNRCTVFAKLFLLVASVAFDFAALVLIPLALVLPCSMLYFVWQSIYFLWNYRVERRSVHFANIPYTRDRVEMYVHCVIVLTSIALVTLGIVSGPNSMYAVDVPSLVKADLKAMVYGGTFLTSFFVIFMLLHKKNMLVLLHAKCCPVNFYTLERFLRCLVPGMIGGQCVVCLKLIAEIVESYVAFNASVFGHGATYVLVLLVVVSSIVHVWGLHNAIVDAATESAFRWLMYAYKFGFSFSASIGAIFFLEELRWIDEKLNLILYCVSLTGLLLMVCCALIFENWVCDHKHRQTVASSTTNLDIPQDDVCDTRTSNVHRISIDLDGHSNANDNKDDPPSTTHPEQRNVSSSSDQRELSSSSDERNLSSSSGQRNLSSASSRPENQRAFEIQHQKTLRQPRDWRAQLHQGDRRYPQPWWTMVVAAQKEKYAPGQVPPSPKASFWRDPCHAKGEFSVRGPTYLSDRRKVPSDSSRMELCALEWSYSPSNLRRKVHEIPDGFVQQTHAGHPDRPFMLIINFMVPSVGNLVAYFVRRPNTEDPVFDQMLHEFVHGTDEHRNDRFKLIPTVKEGGFFVKKAVGNKPALLCNKLSTTYHHGDNCFEVEIDVGSSKVAGSIMGAVKGYASSLVLHLGFLLESKTEAELPERMIGAIDFHFPVMKPGNSHPTTPPSSWTAAVREIATLREAAAHPVGDRTEDPQPTNIQQAPRVDNKNYGDGVPLECGDVEPATASSNRFDDEETVLGVDVADESGTPSPGAVNTNYTGHSESTVSPATARKSQRALSDFWTDAGDGPGRWKIRGPTYLRDKRKVPSQMSCMETVAVDWLCRPNEPTVCISSDPTSLVQTQHVGVPKRPFLFIVNIRVPGTGNLVTYMVPRASSHDYKFDAMLDGFVNGTDEHRNQTFKLIPTVLQGNWFVRSMLGTRPVMAASKVKTQYFRGDNYFELSMDVGSTGLGKSMIGICKGSASKMVVRLGFLIESQTPDELPERMLGGIDLHRLTVEKKFKVAPVPTDAKEDDTMTIV